jgi:hypothetical protein
VAGGAAGAALLVILLLVKVFGGGGGASAPPTPTKEQRFTEALALVQAEPPDYAAAVQLLEQDLASPSQDPALDRASALAAFCCASQARWADVELYYRRARSPSRRMSAETEQWLSKAQATVASSENPGAKTSAAVLAKIDQEMDSLPAGRGPWEGTLEQLVSFGGETHLVVRVHPPAARSAGAPPLLGMGARPAVRLVSLSPALAAVAPILAAAPAPAVGELLEAFTTNKAFEDQVADYRGAAAYGDGDLVRVEGEHATKARSGFRLHEFAPLVELRKVERPDDKSSVAVVGGPPRAAFRPKDPQESDLPRLLQAPPKPGTETAFTCYVVSRTGTVVRISPRSNQKSPCLDLSVAPTPVLQDCNVGARVLVRAEVVHSAPKVPPMFTVRAIAPAPVGGVPVVDKPKTDQKPENGPGPQPEPAPVAPPAGANVSNFDPEAVRLWHAVRESPGAYLGRTIELGGIFERKTSFPRPTKTAVTSSRKFGHLYIRDLFFGSKEDLSVPYSGSSESDAFLEKLTTGEKVVFGVTVFDRGASASSRAPRGAGLDCATGRCGEKSAFHAAVGPSAGTSFAGAGLRPTADGPAA